MPANLPISADEWVIRLGVFQSAIDLNKITGKNSVELTGHTVRVNDTTLFAIFVKNTFRNQADAHAFAKRYAISSYLVMKKEW
jgi:hypothetical protein